MSCGGELKSFDLCIDKGTFDAITLNPDNFNDGKKLYVQSLRKVLNGEGFFAITSCNWTKEQLLDRFSEGEEKIIHEILFLFYLHIYIYTHKCCFSGSSSNLRLILDNCVFGSQQDGYMDIYCQINPDEVHFILGHL